MAEVVRRSARVVVAGFERDGTWRTRRGAVAAQRWRPRIPHGGAARIWFGDLVEERPDLGYGAISALIGCGRVFSLWA